eukprot:1480156-Pyramimonas_sp.AAC.1
MPFSPPGRLQHSFEDEVGLQVAVGTAPGRPTTAPGRLPRAASPRAPSPRETRLADASCLLVGLC